MWDFNTKAHLSAEVSGNLLRQIPEAVGRLPIVLTSVRLPASPSQTMAKVDCKVDCLTLSASEPMLISWRPCPRLVKL